MRIGELAARTGVSTRALRHYEEQDLLIPERSAGGQRHYPESAVDQVGLVQQLYAAGLSSRTIAALMPCVVDGVATPGLIERLAAEREHIDQRIADLTQARNRLDTLIAAASDNLATGRPCRPEAGA